MFDIEVEPKYTTYDSLGELIDKMSEPREDVNENVVNHFPENTETDDFGDRDFDDTDELDETEEIEEIEVISPLDEHISVVKRVDEKKARAEAKFLAHTNDKLHAFVCGIIADEDSHDFEAEDDEVKDIEDAIFQWRRDAETHMPEWLQAIAFITVVYTPIYTRAFRTRKLKKQNEALENELNEKNREIEEMRELISQINEREKKRMKEAESIDFEEVKETKNDKKAD